MNFTLHQLQVFNKVVQQQSITKASIELHMSQPAVSIQLKNFQDQFEIPLTEVLGRQLYVTDFGNEIYKMAQRILDEVYAINFKTMSFHGHLTGRLLLSIVSTGKYVMPYFLSDFIKQNPGVDLIMDVTNKSKVIESLQQNKVDFALVSVMPENLNVHSEFLVENQLFLVGNKQENQVKKSKHELESMPLIFREEGSGTRFTMEKYFKHHRLTVRNKMELTSNEAVKQAVIAGLGNSIMPLIGLRNELLKGDLRIIPAAGLPIRSKWHLIWLKGKKLSPSAEAYLEYVKANKTAVLDEHFSWIHQIISKHKKG